MLIKAMLQGGARLTGGTVVSVTLFCSFLHLSEDAKMEHIAVSAKKNLEQNLSDEGNGRQLCKYAHNSFNRAYFKMQCAALLKCK